jgi:hypothetical protein
LVTKANKTHYQKDTEALINEKIEYLEKLAQEHLPSARENSVHLFNK